MSDYKHYHSAIDLRKGRWQDVLADVGEVDAVITDPPYSKRTHDGNFGGTMTDASAERRAINKKRALRNPIQYSAWDRDDVRSFVEAWSKRCRNWIVAITDHVLYPTWEDSLLAAGWYSFAPLPFFEPGKMPRMGGDGPASWTCWIVVGRPKQIRFKQWGSLPGGYVMPAGVSDDREIVGAKPTWLMRSLVRDYSKEGDIICDPCAGAATTLIAAGIENRRSIGSEADPDTFKIAQRRIARGYTPSMFPGGMIK